MPLRVEPRLAQGRVERFAVEFEPIMQPERPLFPELDQERPQAGAGPVRRSRDRPEGKVRGVERDRLLEGMATLERRRLLAGPGADMGTARPRREVILGFRILAAFRRPP